jgi:hypothetical protein
MEEKSIFGQSVWLGVPRSINAGEVLLSGQGVGTTTAPDNRKAFPDARGLAKGRVRGIVGGERVRAFQPFLMLRIIGLSIFTRVVKERLH